MWRNKTKNSAHYHYEEPKAEKRIERSSLFGSPLAKEKDNSESIHSYHEEIQRAMSKLDEYRDTLSYPYHYIVSDIARTLITCSKFNPEHLVVLMHAVLIRSFSMMKDVYEEIKKKTDSDALIALFDASYQEAYKKHTELNPVNTR